MTTDIGDYLEVPEDQREDVDPPAEYNADAGFDIEVVPDGVVLELSSATIDETEPLEPSDEGDGAPLHFVTPDDPAFDSEED